MRVATRRMRAALALFSEALPVRARHVRTELGWVADALGAVRDLDVQLERLQKWSGDAPDEDRNSLRDLTDLLARERAKARIALLACLDSARYERLVAGFTAMLRQGPSRRSPAARAPAAAAVPELIHNLHRRATKAARRARRSGSADDHHRTRIRGKRLRYALEFVSEIYDGRTAPYVRHVVKLQDNLGEMQDARVAAERLHDLVSSEGRELPPLTVFVMGGMAQYYRIESNRLARKVPRRLHELRGPTWRKLTALMEQRRLEVSSLYRWPPPTPGLRTAGRPAPSFPGAPTARPGVPAGAGHDAGAEAPPSAQPEVHLATVDPASPSAPNAGLWQSPGGHPSGGPGPEPLRPVPCRNGEDPRRG
jgi:triphosphatase